MAAVTADHATAYIGGIPIDQWKGHISAGAIITEIHECTLAINTTNTLTLLNTYATLLTVGITFKTENNADMFAAKPIYWSLSGTTLTGTFPNAPEAEAVTIEVQVRP